MKKLIFATIFIFLFLSTNAQENDNKGRLFLGGSFSFLSQNGIYPYSRVINTTSSLSTDYKNTSFRINPYIGMELSENLFAGFSVEYKLARSRNPYFFSPSGNKVIYVTSSNQITVGIFSRHIIYQIGRLNLFLQPIIDYNLINQYDTQDLVVTDEQVIEYLEIATGFGFMYHLTDKIRANIRSGGIYYLKGSWRKKNSDFQDNFTSFDTSLNLSAVSLAIEIRL